MGVQLALVWLALHWAPRPELGYRGGRLWVAWVGQGTLKTGQLDCVSMEPYIHTDLPLVPTKSQALHCWL